MPKRRHSADSSDSSGSEERHRKKGSKSKASKKHAKKKEKREHKKRSKEAKVSCWCAKANACLKRLYVCTAARRSIPGLDCLLCTQQGLSMRSWLEAAASAVCEVKPFLTCGAVQARRDKEASASVSAVEHARQERMRIIAEAEAREKAQADALAAEVCFLLPIC